MGAADPLAALTLPLRRSERRMVQYWRAAGLTYLRFCQVGQRAMMAGCKPSANAAAVKPGQGPGDFDIVKNVFEKGVKGPIIQIQSQGVLDVLAERAK